MLVSHFNNIKASHKDVYDSLASPSNCLVTKFDDEQLSDVVFDVGNEQTGKGKIHGIRALFAAQSEPLKAMLFGKMAELNPDKRIEINDISPQAFNTFKLYCYGGNLANCKALRNNAVLVDLFTICEKYIIPSLAQVIANIIAENINNDSAWHQDKISFIELECNDNCNEIDGINAIPDDHNYNSTRNDGDHDPNCIFEQELVTYLELLNELYDKNLGKYIRLIFAKHDMINKDVIKWFLTSCPSVLVVLNPLVLGEILFGTPNQHIVSLRSECLWQVLKSYCICFITVQ